MRCLESYLQIKIMESIEFVYLKNLIKTGKAKISISQYFVRKALSFWLNYKNNLILLWVYIFFNFIQGWLGILFFILLAWILHTWWLVILWIVFSFLIDFVMKLITYYFLPDSILRDENLLNYLWELKLGHPTISIQSTKEAQSDYYPKRKMPVIMIIPPNPWQKVVDEFK